MDVEAKNDEDWIEVKNHKKKKDLENKIDKRKVMEAKGTLDKSGVMEAKGMLDKSGVMEAKGTLDKSGVTEAKGMLDKSRIMVGRVEECRDGGEVPVGKVEVTLDSGAGASCWPRNLWPGQGMTAKTEGVRFSTASGEELKYYGNKVVRFATKDRVGSDGRQCGAAACEMKFHVADTTKPLAAAMAVVKMGNTVVLSPEGSYIENVKTKERINLKERGGAYVFDIEEMPRSGFAGRG